MICVPAQAKNFEHILDGRTQGILLYMPRGQGSSTLSSRENSRGGLLEGK